MSECKHNKNVKDVDIDNDFICIELLSGLRLMGPLHTKPVYREPVADAEVGGRQSQARTEGVLAR